MKPHELIGNTFVFLKLSYIVCMHPTELQVKDHVCDVDFMFSEDQYPVHLTLYNLQIKILLAHLNMFVYNINVKLLWY